MKPNMDPSTKADWDRTAGGDAAQFDQFVDKAGQDKPPVDGEKAEAPIDVQGSVRSLMLPKGRDPEPEPPAPTPEENWKAIVGDEEGDLVNELNKPLDMAQTLYDNWNNWGMKGVDFANPPEDFPDDAKETLKFFSDSDTSIRALDNGYDEDSRADSTITRAEVGTFIERAKGDLAAAAGAYKKHLDSPGGGDGTARALAKSAAILMANQSLVAASGERMVPGSDDQRQNNGGIHPSNFKGVADDSSLSDELKDAAALWSHSGMREILDVAGGNQATVDDDAVIGRDNIEHWLSSATPKNTSEVLDVLQQASLTKLGNEVSASLSEEEKKTFFDDLDSRSAKDKAGVFADLAKAATRLQAGKDAGLWDKVSNSLLSHDFDKVQGELADKMTQLASDPEVQKQIRETRNQGMQDLVARSPELKEQLTHYFNEQFVQGHGLDDVDLSRLDDGKQISTDDANDIGKKLLDFAQKGALVGVALGGDGKIDLAAAFEGTGRLDKLREVYEEKIKTAKGLSEQFGHGGFNEDALKDFGTSLAGFSAVLDGKLGSAIAGAGEVLGHLGDILANHATTDDLAVFGGDDGQIDEEKIAQYVEDASKTNPDLFVDDTAKPIKPALIASVVAQVGGLMQNGLSARDALADLGLIGEDTAKPKGRLGKLYDSGTLRAAGAVMSSGVLLTRMLAGNDAPLDKAAIAANAITAFGLTAGATAKIAQGSGGIVDDVLGPILKPGGAVLSAAGGSLLGVVGIISGVNELKKGNQVLGSLAVAGGAVGTALGLVEGAAAVAGLVGAAGAATLGAVASVLGPVGFVVGVGLIVAQMVIGGAARGDQKRDFIEGVAETVLPYGIGYGTVAIVPLGIDPSSGPLKS
jgi:trimeric autotransporter adhesin